MPRKDVEQAAADLGAARAAAVTARRAQQLSVLRSPVSGVVTRMSAVLGASADAGQMLVEIADPSAFDVVLSLGPTEAGAVRPGARVTISAGEKTRRRVARRGHGRVGRRGGGHRLALRGDSRRRVTHAAPRAPARRERVRRDRRRRRSPNAVVIPVEAIVPEGAGYKVFVVDKSGTAHEREVKIGGRTATKVEIIEGLNGGETVVTQGAFGVEDSAKVAAPVPAKP